ncbi:MAG: spore maturation protein [Clostridia bacterium]|nr:spore maturation protein [Clostridia bacterium]
MSKVWTAIIIISIVFAIFCGNASNVTNSILENSQKAVDNIPNITGMLCFWSGIFKIFEGTSVVEKLADKMSVIIKKLFDKNSLSKEAEKYISLNIVSNILGVGNAATVNGIKAIKELSKYSKEGVASDNMTKFVLINTASIQIFPTSMISLRTLYGSANPAKIVIPIIVISVIALVGGLIMINILNKVMREE